MRPSLPLTILALVGNFAYGFSSLQKPLFVVPPTPRQPPVPKGTTIRLKMPPSVNVSRGGSMKATTQDAGSESTTYTKVASIWGTAGVVYILAKAIRRVLPIALEPFLETSVPLSQVQLGSYVLCCAWFAYVEGYKGFQTKFAPLVVARSRTIKKWNHVLFAPFYSMGLFHATKKRLTVSWCVTLGVAGIVALVKKLPYPWRNIVDAGVVAGLSWGSISILVLLVKSLYQGKSPDIDPALPSQDGDKKE